MRLANFAPSLVPSRKKLLNCYVYGGLSYNRQEKNSRKPSVPDLFFPMGQDVNKIGILIHEFFIMYLIFYLSEVSLSFDDVFLLQAKKI